VKNLAPVALITGGARRIGATVVKRLHQEGYRVAIHCHNSIEAANKLADTLNAEKAESACVLQAKLGGQLAAQQLAKDLIKRFGRCDLLINNASSFYPTPLEGVSETAWDELFSANAKAPLFLAQALSEKLKVSKGCIINIADIHALRPLKKHTIYSMAKAANIMLTKSLALELAPDIRVNGIAPGAILWAETNSGQLTEKPDYLDTLPLRSLGGGDSIASSIVFLAKPDNYITGHILCVDGGKSLLQ